MDKKTLEVNDLALLHVDFYSAVLGMNCRMDAILPMLDGADDGKPWKTLWLLHGMTDDNSMWQRKTAIERYAEAAGLAVIMPDAQLGWYCDTPLGEKWFQFIAMELMTAARRMFPRLSTAREDNFAAGISMGGYGALKLALAHPQLVAKTVCLSGAVDAYGMTQLAEPLADAAYWRDVFGPAEAIRGSQNDLFFLAQQLPAGKRPDIYMWCGREDFLYDMNIAMRDHLRDLDYALDWHESPGDHQWRYWDREIGRAIEWLTGKEGIATWQ